MLFVAEKRAVIEVVVARLQRAGLGELVMDAHGGIKSKREFAQSMSESMRVVRTVPLQDYSDLHGRLWDTRAQLIAHVEAMHESRDPWNVSLYEVQEKLLAAPWPIAASSGMTSAKARDLDRAKVDQLMREVQEWSDLRGQELDSLYPEWSRCNVNSPGKAQEALSLIRNLLTLALPDTKASVLALLDEAGVTRPDAVGTWRDLLLWLRGLDEFFTEFGDEILTLDHRTLIAALGPARQWWKPWVVLTSRKYRAARDAVRETHLAGAKLPGEGALLALEKASELMERWSSLTTGAPMPGVPDQLDAVLGQLESLIELLHRAETIFSREGPLLMPHPDIEAWLGRLAEQEQVAATLPRIRQLRSLLISAGFEEAIARLGRDIPAEYAAAAIQQSWLKTVRDDVVFGDVRVSNFTEAVHDRRQRDFVELDRQHLSLTPERVRRSVAESAIAAMNSYQTEAEVVRREAAKSTRHIPIRRLFQQAPHVLTALRPCWVMSPLLVAELIPADSDLFDVVIFDEASQIPPAEAIGVLGRAP